MQPRNIFLPVSIFFIVLVLVAGVHVASRAQSWNIRTPVRPVVQGEAVVVKVDQGLKVLTLRYDTSQIAGEYKLTSCFVDEDSRLERDGKLIQISDLREGDLVEIEGKIYDDENRSCGLIQVKTGKPTENIPTEGGEK